MKLLRPLRPQGLHPVPRLPGRLRSRTTSSTTTSASRTTSCCRAAAPSRAAGQRHRRLDDHVRRHRAARQHRPAPAGRAAAPRGRGRLPRQLQRRPDRRAARPCDRLPPRAGAVAWFVAATPSHSFHIVTAADDGVVKAIEDATDAGIRINGGFFVMPAASSTCSDPARSSSTSRSRWLIDRSALTTTATTGSSCRWTRSRTASSSTTSTPRDLHPGSCGAREVA